MRSSTPGPEDSYAGPLPRSSLVPACWALPLCRAKRFPRPPGLSSPPSLVVPHASPVQIDLVPPTAKATPLRKPQTYDTTAVHAGTPKAYMDSGCHASIHKGWSHGMRALPETCATWAPCRALRSPKPTWQGLLVDSVSALMHHQCRASVLQWNIGLSAQEPHADPSRSLWSRPCCDPPRGVGSLPHISERFYAYTDGNDLTILLDKDTFEVGAAVFTISEASTSKDTWGLAVLVARGLLRRPSVADSPTVTFYSVHLHNKVAKKCDASTSLSLSCNAFVST